MKKYQIVMSWLLKKIENGSITPGEKLPSESQLIERFNVSRNAIRQAINELIKQGFVESRQGQGTFCIRQTRQKTMVVGIICLRVTSYIFPQIIEGCNRTLHSKGYHLLFNESRYDLAAESQILHSLRQQGVDGIIITPVQYDGKATNSKILTELEKQGIPVVLLDNEYPDYSFSSVVLDDVGAGMKAAEFLWKRGHRDIGMLYSLNYRPKILRYNGVMQFLQSKNITVNKDWLIGIEGQFSAAHTYRQVRTHFKKHAKIPTAMICSSDDEAIMFIHQVRKHGLKVPDDVSVISFDNSNVAQVSHPRLTSLNHPSEYMGKLAADLLLQRINNTNPSLQNHTVIESAVIERDSVRSLI